MRHTFIFMILTLSWVNLIFASDMGAQEVTDIKQMAKSITNFGCDVNRTITNGADNHVFSAFSMSSALSLLFAGTKGDTSKAMSETLHFGKNTKEFHKTFGGMTKSLMISENANSTLRIANDIWLKDGSEILSSYENTLLNAYNTKPRIVDFSHSMSAAAMINKYISEQTDGLIKNLFNTLPEETTMIITNAIYFQSFWGKAFSEDRKNLDFNLIDGTSKKIDFMQKRDTLFMNEDDEKKYIVLPYERKNMAALVVVPNEGMMSQFEANLSSDMIDSMMTSVARTEVRLSMPSFTMETTLPSMKGLLSSLGMGIIFNGERADLSGINGVIYGDEKLTVSDVIHKARIEVSESGTKAAAATGVLIARSTSVMRPPAIRDFIVDRPFYFFIVDTTTNLVMFTARVMNPS